MLIAYAEKGHKDTTLISKEYSWEKLAQRMAKVNTGDKDGSYIIRGGKLKDAHRENDNLLEAELLIIDGDSSFDPETGEVFTDVDPDDGKVKGNCTTIEQARDALDALGYRYIIHTTHTHTPGILNKWRAYIPAKMTSPDELKPAVEYVMRQMHAKGCYVEANNESTVWAQPWYLPRVKAKYIDSYRCYASLSGNDVNVAAAVEMAMRDEEEKAAVRAERAKDKPKLDNVPQGPSPIEMYNRAVDMNTARIMLEGAGYKFAFQRKGIMRFEAPGSTTKTAGVSLMKGAQRGDVVAYSHHGAHDPLSHRLTDAFGLLTRLYHGGNEAAAMAEAMQAINWTQNKGVDLDDFKVEVKPEDFKRARLEAEIKAPAGPLFTRAATFAGSWQAAEYLVDGLVQRGWCYSLTSPTGHGKTAVILTLAATIGAGLQFAGQETLKGRVGYFAAENPNDVQARWIGMTESMKLEDPDVYFCPYTIDLATSFEQIAAEAEAAGGFDLIIVDTSQAFFKGDNENDNKQMVDHAKAMRKLTQLPGNPCVIILCHPTKNASKDNLLPRGGGGFIAEVDGNLTIWNDGDNITMSHQGKFRGAGFAPINFVLKVVQPFALKDAKGRQMSTVVSEYVTEDAFRMRLQDHGTDQDKVMICLLSRKGNISVREIAKMNHWVTEKGQPQASKVARLIQQLRDAKLVITNRFGKSVLTKAGKAEIGAKARALGIDGAGEDEDVF